MLLNSVLNIYFKTFLYIKVRPLILTRTRRLKSWLKRPIYKLHLHDVANWQIKLPEWEHIIVKYFCSPNMTWTIRSVILIFYVALQYVRILNFNGKTLRNEIFFQWKWYCSVHSLTTLCMRGWKIHLDYHNSPFAFLVLSRY